MMSAGSVQARKTSGRGASNTRVITRSRSPSVVISVLSVEVDCVILGDFLFLEFLEDFVEALEALLPVPAVALHPDVDVLQRPGVEGARAPLGIAATADEAGALEH